MARWGAKNKIGSAAHIKQHTEGTSNEISFSVLDAAKMEVEGRLGHHDTEKKPGIISLFSLPRRRKHHETPHRESDWPLLSSGEEGADAAGADGGAGVSRVSLSAPLFSPLAREEEIARRKSRRRLYRLVAGIGIGCVIVLAAVLVVTVGVSMLQEHEQRVDGMKSALLLLEDADEVIARIDEVLDDPLDPSQVDEIDELLEEIPNQVAVLESVSTALSALYDGIIVPRDREAATSAIGSADARLAMLDAAERVLEEARSASSAWQSAEDAWENVLAADVSAREAAELAAEGTTESIVASNDRSSEALLSLQTAAESLAAATLAYPSVDLSAFQAYVEKRIEALTHAIASNDALLAEDTELALTENDAYNEADTEAAQLAQALSESASEKVAHIFENRVAEDMTAYRSAQLRATSTDSYLRSYQ